MSSKASLEKNAETARGVSEANIDIGKEVSWKLQIKEAASDCQFQEAVTGVRKETDYFKSEPKE